MLLRRLLTFKLAGERKWHYQMALFHCMVRHGTVHFWGVFHWVLYLVPDTFLVPLRSRFHRAVPLPKRDV